MKTDIPDLMKQRQLDAIVVSGNTATSSDLAYLVTGAHLENVLYVQRQGAAPHLFVSILEREVAQACGYAVHLWSEYDISEYLKRHDGDLLQAKVTQWSDLLGDLGVEGRVGFYGTQDMGFSYQFLGVLAAANPQIEVVGEAPPNLFNQARQTKDASELALMRDVGKRTTAVIDAIFGFLQSHRPADEILRKSNSEPLTIGDVKTRIRLELAQRGLEEVHPTIFSQGRDAGIPHNTGQVDMPLQLGQTIIFDIFPRDRESGYYHDITRSFFLGYAPDDLAARWQQVKNVFDTVMAALEIGRPCRDYQAMACDLFEELGYPTGRSHPGTMVGYNHGLGHGLGLDIHEAPRLNLLPGNDTQLQPGHVFTIEPGLYYPDEGWGVRIEDTVAFDENGRVQNLSAYPYPMVIPLD